MNSQTTESHIFVVSVVLYQDYRRRYPVFEAHECVCGYSQSLNGAEKLMHDVVSKDNAQPVYCYYIREIGLETVILDWNGNGRLSERVYDAEGVLLDARLSGWNDAYIGRDPKTIRFACGDIVEAYFPYQNQVILGYVMELPPTKDELRSWVERDKKFASDDMPVTRDASDDTYMFMQDDKGGHEHQDALYVFKPHFPIPKPTLERLKKQYRRYLERYANKYFHKPLTNDERSWLKAHNVDIEP